jgi:hypothetical protein
LAAIGSNMQCGMGAGAATLLLACARSWCGARGTAHRHARPRGGRCASGRVRPGLARLQCGRCRRPDASASVRAPPLRSSRRRFAHAGRGSTLRAVHRQKGLHQRHGNLVGLKRHHGAIAANDLVIGRSVREKSLNKIRKPALVSENVPNARKVPGRPGLAIFASKAANQSQGRGRICGPEPHVSWPAEVLAIG